MTVREAAIVSAHTGVLVGAFRSMHLYAQDLLDRAILEHEFKDKKVAAKIKELSRSDFLNIKINY